MSESDSEFSDKHRRLYRWFFKEYNNQYINYEKYYKASEYYRKRAEQVRWGTGILSSLIVIFVLMIVKGIYPNLLTSIAILASLLTGVISLVGVVGDFERKSITYYNSGQEHDDLYSEFDKMVKVKLSEPGGNYNKLKGKCEMLIERKDELNGLTPQLKKRWYDELIEERGNNAIHWDPQPLEQMQKAQFEPDSDSE